MALYSERFCFVNAGVTHAQFTVPAGKRAVLRSGHFANFGTAEGAYSLAIGAVTFWKGAVPASVSTSYYEGRQVAYGGETIHIYTSGSDVRGALSGYLFDSSSSAAADEPAGALVPPAEEAPPGFREEE